MAVSVGCALVWSDQDVVGNTREIRADQGFQPAREKISRGVLRYFITLSVPLCLVVGGILAIIYHSELSTDATLAQRREQQNISASQRSLLLDLGMVLSDVTFLAKQSSLQELLAGGKASARGELEHDYRIFCATKQAYDQLRYIDASGKELVCVKRSNGKPAVVLWDQLQDRSDDELFKTAMALDKDEVCLSRLALYAEGGEIQKPHKPMIRTATPVFDRNGAKRGAIVLNYLAANMLQKLKPDNQMLVNAEGYWLHGGPAEARWGFMFQSDNTMARAWPHEWNEINRLATDQFSTGNGLFTFATISPLEDAVQHLHNAGNVAVGHQPGQERASWKLVSHVPNELLYARSHGLRAGLVWFSAVMMVLISLVSLHYAFLMARRREMQRKLREHALIDSLTKSYNRRFGLQMFERLLKECKRLTAKLCVFMVDVDNLKTINDTFGHKAGDEVILLIASALRNGLREVDMVCRFGGDEFLVVMPFTMLDGGAIGIERIKRNLARSNLSKYAPVTIGFSYGGAEYDPQRDQPIAELVDAADAAMYRKKRKSGAEGQPTA